MGKVWQPSEPVLLNVYGVPELIPRNEFRQPMWPGGPVRKPYSSSVPSPHRLFKNSSSVQHEERKLRARIFKLFMFCTLIKLLGVCRVSAEMLNCKLHVLSIQAAGIKHLYFYMMRWKSSLARRDRTLARTLCSVEEPNVIVKKLNFCCLYKYKRMINSKLKASNALLNSAEYAITRKEHFSFLA
jgi:hypothetical protein